VLNVTVPRGPTWASGLYRLVPGEWPNSMPLWKAVRADLWMYSTANGKWGIGGRKELDLGFQTSAAYVFCDSPHGGMMPDRAPREWFHNKPAWTLDVNIGVEGWEETIFVVLEKQDEIDKYGLQCSITELEEAPDAIGSPIHAELTLDAQAQPSSVLRLHDISEGSLLAQWNARMAAEGRRSDVVTVDCDIVRVNGKADLERMQQALRECPKVEIELQRPTGLQPRQDPCEEEQEEKVVEVDEADAQTQEVAKVQHDDAIKEAEQGAQSVAEQGAQRGAQQAVEEVSEKGAEQVEQVAEKGAQQEVEPAVEQMSEKATEQAADQVAEQVAAGQVSPEQTPEETEASVAPTKEQSGVMKPDSRESTSFSPLGEGCSSDDGPSQG